MNAVMLPMYVVSGVFFSSERFPDAVQPLIKALPLTLGAPRPIASASARPSATAPEAPPSATAAPAPSALNPRTALRCRFGPGPGAAAAPFDDELDAVMDFIDLPFDAAA